MYNGETGIQNTPKETTYASRIVSSSKQDGAKSDVVSAPDAAIFSLPLALIVSCAVVFLMMYKKWTLGRHEIPFSVKRSQHIPCRNCQYFSGNYHLKCAVHPETALTEEAKDCSDYLPQNEKS
ncbi:hypothetical protein [Aerosakkonema funiforme]|uniref:hypothetical protein n=1 Tax=Aerosakkonema funiforme TaxID=1246630 RepID=UPI0035B74BAB